VCGIAGVLNFDGSSPDPELVRRMNQALAHRGPDGEGCLVRGHVGLGHRRLAVIDPTPGGDQPMASPDGGAWVTYNGEIYNFRETRRLLEQHGHRFRSKSDTEVLLRSYQQWGVDCLERLNGMFAFAVWDERERRLWLARDRLGVKPLFYCRLPRSFVFASEIKAILCHPEVERALDFEALAYFLALNYTPAPHTLFKAIRQVLPGHHVSVDLTGQVRDTEYWDVVYREVEPRSAAAWTESFAQLLEDSVRLRLVSDVPFGAFLSGGVDSSCVAYWMSRHMSSPVKTFSIGFDHESFDERPYARQVARAIGADHYDEVVTADAAALLPTLVWHAEEPTADSSMVAVYRLAAMTRRFVTVALSGDGADEILAGYETYRASNLHRLYRLLPRFLRERVIAPLVRGLPVSDAKLSLDFRLRRFVAAGELPWEDAHATWRMIHDAEQRRRLLGPVWEEPGARADPIDLYRAAFARTTARKPLDRMLYVDTRVYLPNDMLVKVDRMTMAHGLEAREPFLDYRLVELAAQIPPELKLKWMYKGKHLLKASMRGRLPDAILDRRKAGFNVPKARWIRQGLKPFVMDHLTRRRVQAMAILDAGVVEAMLDEHFAGRADWSHQIWGLLTLVLWWQQFVEGSAAPRAGASTASVSG
jgi:asparagine synthase (glutamine-hydrolysing)